MQNKKGSHADVPLWSLRTIKNRHMKILVIPSWYPPNSGRFFQELNEALYEENNTVDVLVNTITSFKNFQFKHLFNKNVCHNEAGLNVYRNKFYNIPKLNFLSNRLWIQNTFNRYVEYSEKNGHPDIIHAHSSIWAGIVAYKINRKFKVSYVITEHRSRFVYNTEEAKKMLPEKYFPLIKKALKNASLITGVSPSLNKKLIDIEESVKDKIIIIPNTVDTNIFKPINIEKPEDTFRWFSLGKLNYVKGFDILLKAFSELKNKTDKNIVLRIGGDGPEYKKLLQLRKFLNLEKNVVFLGKLGRNDVITEMQNAHAFVLPSRFEAFGVVYIEAAACGLPVIGTDAGGQRSIIDKNNGYIVEIENINALTNAMADLIKNYNLFNKQNIRDLTIEKYNKTSVAKEYCRQFSKIINE